MPEYLINATVDSRREDSDPKKIDEDTYYARLRSRTPYRVIGKGRPEGDGTFRFYYPAIDTKKNAHIDHATGKEVKRPVLKQKTLSVSPDSPESPESMLIIKQLHMFELRSDDWQKWYAPEPRRREQLLAQARRVQRPRQP